MNTKKEINFYIPNNIYHRIIKISNRYDCSINSTLDFLVSMGLFIMEEYDE